MSVPPRRPRFMRLALLLLVVGMPDLARAEKAPRCNVAFGSRVKTLADGSFEITALITNQTGAALQLAMKERCPAGPIVFQGISPAYDFDGTCKQPPCQTLVAEQRRSIPPGTHELSTVVIDPKGGPCNPPLPVGNYPVTFVAPPLPAKAIACPVRPVQLAVKPRRRSGKPMKRMKAPDPCEAVTAVPCNLACPGERKHDASGCELCACAADPLTQ